MSQRTRATLRAIEYFANDTAEYGVCKSRLVFHWNYVSLTFPQLQTTEYRYRCVTDADVQTSSYNIVRAMYTRRAVKIMYMYINHKLLLVVNVHVKNLYEA